VLGVSIVDGDDGEAQHAFLGHRAQPDHAGCRLFRSANHTAERILPLGVKNRDQVGAVIHGDVRLVIDRRKNVAVIGVVVFAFDGEHGNPMVAHQAGRDIVLRRERIRGAQYDIGASVPQSDCQVRCFRRHVQARGHANPFQRLVLDKFFADDLQNFHRLVRPVNALLAKIGKFNALNVTLRLGWYRCHTSPAALPLLF
jgi:hypothetical protein